MSAKGSYPKGVAKREEILRIALEIFAQEGYRGTSLREVARSCGLSLPGLMHYFDSKEELLVAILRKRDQIDATGSFDPARDPIQVLSEIMRHNAQVPGLVQLFATLSAAASDPAHPAHEFFVDRYASFREQLALSMSQRQASGKLNSDLDVNKMAAIIIALADGLQVQWMLDPQIDMAEHVEYLMEIVTARNAS